MTEEQKPIFETLDDIIIPETQGSAISEPRERYENEETFLLECKGSSPDDKDDRVRRFMGTSGKRDRKGDEVTLSGWDFSGFKRNPIVIWNHRLSGELTDILGRVKRIKREKVTQGKTVEEGWVFDVWFAPGPSEAHPNMHGNGDLALSLLDMKVLNACSVTFRPIHSEYIEDEPEEIEEQRKKRRHEEPGRRWITKELLEFSLCMVGAHKDALQLVKSKGLTLPDFMQAALEDVATVSKPGWDDKDEYNEIRYRVRDPGEFQDDSFRRVPIQKTPSKVFAIMGKLKGQTTLTIQSLRFPKGEGWTLAKAKAWLKEHSALAKSLPDITWLEEPGNEEPAAQIGQEMATGGVVSIPIVFTPTQTNDQPDITWNEPAMVQEIESRRHQTWLDAVVAEATRELRRKAAASQLQRTNAESVEARGKGPSMPCEPTAQRPAENAEQVTANQPVITPLHTSRKYKVRVVKRQLPHRKTTYKLRGRTKHG